jgi:hypothetical protein
VLPVLESLAADSVMNRLWGLIRHPDIGKVGAKSLATLLDISSGVSKRYRSNASNSFFGDTL